MYTQLGTWGWMGSGRPKAIWVPDRAVVYDPAQHHLEPQRGVGHTLVVFDKGQWLRQIQDHKYPLTIAVGYCTALSLGYPDVKAWMTGTSYQPYDKETTNAKP